MGSLVRPSVALGEEHEKRRASQNELRRQASASALASGSFKPRLKHLSHEELASLKSAEADQIIGKIHDEELMQQQLDVALSKRLAQIRELTRLVPSGGGRDWEKVLVQQQRIIEGRGNALLAKANEVRACTGNATAVVRSRH